MTINPVTAATLTFTEREDGARFPQVHLNTIEGYFSLSCCLALDLIEVFLRTNFLSTSALGNSFIMSELGAGSTLIKLRTRKDARSWEMVC